MDNNKLIKLSIQIETENNEPLKISSIRINDQLFIPSSYDEDSISTERKDSKISKNDIPLSALSLIPDAVTADEEEGQVTVETNHIPAVKAIAPGDTYNTLEEFGGDSFYKMFWGVLSYQWISEQQSKVTFEGKEDVFDGSFVGKWLEPSRIHKCAVEFPATGRNYFPGAQAVVYARVLEVLDGKNLLVDYGYNGGDRDHPKPISKQDGIFFFDNKFAIQSWAQSAKRKDVLKANQSQIYATLGMPKIVVRSDESLSFTYDGGGESPAIHLMKSDAFSGDVHGQGLESSQSYKETFGDNGKFFELPGAGKVSIDFDWQFIPATYSQKVVQYGSETGLFFNDGSADSKQYGLKRVSNINQFRIRDFMKKSLGFVRAGVTFSMPNQGYCNGGGIHDGRDITEFCTYRFEGDWFAKNPNNMKARTSGGLRVEWIGKSKEQPGNFIEMESFKAYRFDDLKFRFLSNCSIEVDDPDFTWYHLASQEWTGGTSTGSDGAHLVINGYRVELSTNGDFWLVYGDEDVKARNLKSHQVSIFDKIPAPGDIITQNLEDLKNNGLIGKPAEDKFEIWGWAVQKGDVLSFEGKNYTVIQTERKAKTWAQFAEQFSSAPLRLKRNDRKVNYTEIQLDKSIPKALGEISFRVVQGALQSALNGQEIKGCSAVWLFGNDAPGHLMYTDYNVNLYMQNVQINGLIRSTSRPLWAETSESLKGSISSIPVGNLGSAIWHAGDRLQLAHPETGLLKEVDLIVGFSGNAGNLLIKPTQLDQEFPAGSIVTALYSLCSTAEFDHVNFVNEDLTPCFSERIDYRPQGLRLRQLLTRDDSKRVKINGGRLSWYSNLDNRFEPEVTLSNKPHLVDARSVVNVMLNPIVLDGKGAHFGYQYKQAGEQEIFIQNRIVARGDSVIDLSNSIVGSDLYLEGNGKFLLNNLRTAHYIDNGKDKGVGFNVVVNDRFVTSKSLRIEGKSGKVGMMITTPYEVGVLRIDLQNWELLPGIFNEGGFQTKQDRSKSNYSEFVKIKGS